jgi:serine/threonine protein kinase
LFVVVGVVTGVVVWHRVQTDRKLREMRTWEIKFSELVFGEELGRGSFGRVVSGIYRGSLVAIKMLDSELLKGKSSTKAKTGFGGPSSKIAPATISGSTTFTMTGTVVSKLAESKKSAARSANNSDPLKDFLAEIQLMSSLMHPNIVLFMGASIARPVSGPLPLRFMRFNRSLPWNSCNPSRTFAL